MQRIRIELLKSITQEENCFGGKYLIMTTSHTSFSKICLLMKIFFILFLTKVFISCYNSFLYSCMNCIIKKIFFVLFTMYLKLIPGASKIKRNVHKQSLENHVFDHNLIRYDRLRAHHQIAIRMII